ncbi:DNA gyrase inhibitor YacG [Marinobacter sp. AC-23]|uniref:DNA gyrase inhibitor YacG n=1 Tax=Marinobacter sp. AC-23 TaxID=1879031 RepID=UPI000A401BC7|nr:DNA gyrase inhibitor YacG [Marinobacter sp. AC-23]
MNVECPTCKKSVEWTDTNTWRPFCSERCKLIDLGAWANEEYRVPAENATQTILIRAARLHSTEPSARGYRGLTGL